MDWQWLFPEKKQSYFDVSDQLAVLRRELGDVRADLQRELKNLAARGEGASHKVVDYAASLWDNLRRYERSGLKRLRKADIPARSREVAERTREEIIGHPGVMLGTAILISVALIGYGTTRIYRSRTPQQPPRKPTPRKRTAARRRARARSAPPSSD